MIKWIQFNSLTVLFTPVDLKSKWRISKLVERLRVYLVKVNTERVSTSRFRRHLKTWELSLVDYASEKYLVGPFHYTFIFIHGLIWGGTRRNSARYLSKKKLVMTDNDSRYSLVTHNTACMKVLIIRNTCQFHIHYWYLVKILIYISIGRLVSKIIKDIFCSKLKLFHAKP